MEIPLTGCSSPWEARVAELITDADIVFGSSVWCDGIRRDLLLDAFLPEGEGPHPAIVLIHGGGFRTGSRKDKNIVTIAQMLVAEGFIVISPD
jgi:acetyl esterase/lipase